MALGNAEDKNQYVLREYEEGSARVRLMQLFENERPVGFRVENCTPGGSGWNYDSQVFGNNQEQYMMAIGCFKGFVLPLVDL